MRTDSIHNPTNPSCPCLDCERSRQKRLDMINPILFWVLFASLSAAAYYFAFVR
jgi:hypothetical protein